MKYKEFDPYELTKNYVIQYNNADNQVCELQLEMLYCKQKDLYHLDISTLKGDDTFIYWCINSNETQNNEDLISRLANFYEDYQEGILYNNLTVEFKVRNYESLSYDIENYEEGNGDYSDIVLHIDNNIIKVYQDTSIKELNEDNSWNDKLSHLKIDMRVKDNIIDVLSTWWDDYLDKQWELNKLEPENLDEIDSEWDIEQLEAIKWNPNRIFSIFQIWDYKGGELHSDTNNGELRMCDKLQDLLSKWIDEEYENENNFKKLNYTKMKEVVSSWIYSDNFESLYASWNTRFSGELYEHIDNELKSVSWSDFIELFCKYIKER